jgi:hypothetical protein
MGTLHIKMLHPIHPARWAVALSAGRFSMEDKVKAKFGTNTKSRAVHESASYLSMIKFGVAPEWMARAIALNAPSRILLPNEFLELLS